MQLLKERVVYHGRVVDVGMSNTSKRSALREYAPISEMRLITREYGGDNTYAVAIIDFLTRP